MREVNAQCFQEFLLCLKAITHSQFNNKICIFINNFIKNYLYFHFQQSILFTNNPNFKFIFNVSIFQHYFILFTHAYYQIILDKFIMCFLSSKAPVEKPPQPKVMTKGTHKKSVKLVLCGNAAVGKTSITMRYKQGMFKKFHEPTLAGAYQEKKIKTKNGEELQLNIWDTAGDQRFRSIMPLYYRDAQIALLVFDLTDAESFKGIDYWLNELQEKVKTQGMLLCLVGNKKDLIEQRRVSKQQGFLKANDKKCLYHQTSALSGEGVDELFEKVVEQYFKRKKQKLI